MNYLSLPDDGLLKMLRADDEDALQEIYRRYWKEMYFAVLRKIHVSQVAEELVQNLFVSLWNNRKTSAIRQLKNYLYTAVKYQVINFIKSKTIRERYTLQSSLFVAREENNSESVLLTHELSKAIEEAIRKLPEKSQQIFRLNRMENQNVRQIARDMNISEKTVEYHITRTLKIMRIYLRDFF